MKKFNTVKEYMAAIPEVVNAADRLIAKVEASRQNELAKVWAEFKETSDFIIQSRQRRKDRLSKE